MIIRRSPSWCRRDDDDGDERFVCLREGMILDWMVCSD